MKRSPVLLPLALLVLTACGGAGDDTRASDPVAGPTSPAAAAPSAAPSSTPVPSVAASTPADDAPSAAASPTAPGTGAAAAPASPAAPGTAARSAGPAPAPAAPASLATRAGRYTYDSRGTFTAGGPPQSRTGTSTLTVDPQTGDRQSAVLEGDSGRTETDAVLRGDGRYLARLVLTTPAFSKEFQAAPPVLLLPEESTPGKSWTFTLRSTDGKTTATARNRIVRSERVTVGGTAVDTRVVETVLALRGDVVYDGTTTTNYAPAQRLAVRERGSGKGTVSGIAFSAETSSSLRSLDPA